MHNLLNIPETANKGTLFYDYENFWNRKIQPFDFIFVDGINELRKRFSIISWDFLKINGYMAFHDTRRVDDFQNVLDLLKIHQNEISEVQFNYCNSNITILQKKELAEYDNWQVTEARTPQQLGY